MSEHKCELCGQPVRVVGDTTLHYEPVSEYPQQQEHWVQIPTTGHILPASERIKSLETTVLEQSDQIESLSAECERAKRAICDVETCQPVSELSDEIAGYLKLSDNLLVFVEWQAAKIEQLTWIDYGDGPASVFCRHCSRKKPKHTPGCPAGEE